MTRIVHDAERRMRCPHCAGRVTLPQLNVTRLRHQRRAKGLCGECGKIPSTKYRCEPCAIRAKVNRALSVEHELNHSL